MNKKDYEKPTMQVVKLKQQCHILAGSATGAATMDVSYESENWE